MMDNEGMKFTIAWTEQLRTWKLDKSIDKKCLQDMQEPRLDNMNSMCFAEVQVWKLLLEHGTY